MPPDFSDYKETVDGLMTGGLTNSQTQALIEFHERSQNRLRDDLRGEMHGIRDELRGEMHGIRDELRKEMHDGFQAISERLDGIIDHLNRLEDRVTRLESWLLAGMGTTCAALLAAVITLLILVARQL